VTGDWAGNGLAGNSGWAPKDRSKRKKKDRGPWWIWLVMLATILITWVVIKVIL
jgi:hypothetical protein